MKICDYCGFNSLSTQVGPCNSRLSKLGEHLWVDPTVLPTDQGKRTAKRPRHDLIPLEFLDELASIFEEGLLKYGDSWKKGGRDFLIDCLNHASNHFHKYCNGDTSENQLAKVAWNVLVVRYFDLKEQGLDGNTREEPNVQDVRQGSTTTRDVERNVQSRPRSEREMVDRFGIGTASETQRARDAMPDPQRDF